MNRHLSQADRRRAFELIHERDGGLHCIYCKKLLSSRTLVFEHLNNNDTDNRLENLAFACQSCNIKKSKKTTDNDRLLIMADAKLTMNEKKLFVGEKFVNSFTKKFNIYGESSKEIEINKKNNDIVEEYLRDEINKYGSVLFKDALDSCVYLCQSNTGHGSQQSIRNYFASLTSSVAPYEISRDIKNKKIIQKRF